MAKGNNKRTNGFLHGLYLHFNEVKSMEELPIYYM